MESINKVELQGRVGSVRNGSWVTRFTLATNEVYNDRNGSQIIETTWHTCQVPEKAVSEPIEKGDIVRVLGRIRNCKYTGADGSARVSTDILVGQYKVMAKPKD